MNDHEVICDIYYTYYQSTMNTYYQSTMKRALKYGMARSLFNWSVLSV